MYISNQIKLKSKETPLKKNFTKMIKDNLVTKYLLDSNDNIIKFNDVNVKRIKNRFRIKLDYTILYNKTHNNTQIKSNDVNKKSINCFI